MTTTSSDRLGQALLARPDLTPEIIANALDVHPKSVQRWLAGVSRPRLEHRAALAAILEMPASEIWPTSDRAARGEVLDEYGSRAEMSAEVWTDLLRPHAQAVDVLAYAAAFLADVDPRWLAKVAGLASFGATVRVCLADPESPAVAQRAAEEGLTPDALGGRIGASWAVFRRALDGVDGVEIRQHSTTLYCSWFRCDSTAIVTPHVWGVPGAEAPALHLRRLGALGLFDAWQAGFERVWSSAVPIGQAGQ